MLTRILFAALLATSAACAQQVSLNVVTTGGSDTLTVPPGLVELALDIQVDSELDLDGAQFALFSSNPDLFAYGPDPVYSLPAPSDPPTTFSEADLLGSPPAAGSPLTNPVPIGLFTIGQSIPFSTQLPVSTMTIRVQSVGELEEGSYTFTTGDPGFGYNWTSPDAGGPLVGDFINPGVFTLEVRAAEPQRDLLGDYAVLQATALFIFVLLYRWFLRIFG